MQLVARVEQRVQKLRTDDDLVAHVARSEMLSSDRSNRCFDWLCHQLGLDGRIISERERLVATVPLLNKIVFLAGVCLC